MPAAHIGLGTFFLDRNLNNMQTGYHIPVLGGPPAAAAAAASPLGLQQQQQHLAALATGLPITYSGLPGYNFIPYPQHRHITHMTGGFDLKVASPYHHALLARGCPFYPPYRAAGPAAEDPGRAGANKVATRESTGALKAWLNEHLKNPYPTKGEKIMLAIITKMSLTQVSTWFANARRRLKKENRVSWASKGKSDEEEEDEEEEEEGGSEEDEEVVKCHLEEEVLQSAGTEERLQQGAVESSAVVKQEEEEEHEEEEEEQRQRGRTEESKAIISSPKPKIWSLAETATSETVKKNQNQEVLYQPAGRLWADWASRNRLFLPTCYTSPEIL